MNYLNIHTDLLRSESYLGAEPIERATWLNLMGWCASQENGGVIQGAARWTDRKWQQLCGITKEEATLVSELYQINEGGNMVVSLYPIEKETEVRTKRATAKVNGKKGGRPKKKPTSVNFTKAEGNGREGKGMEWKESDTQENIPARPPIVNSQPGRVHTSDQTPNNMADLKTWINSLKPEWKLPARWGHSEERSLFESAAQIAELTPEDRDLISRYMAARVPKGAGFWQPRSRGQFAENFADVCGHAQRWGSKSRSVTTATPRPPEPKQDISEHEEGCEAYRKETGCTMSTAEILECAHEYGKYMEWMIATIPSS